MAHSDEPAHVARNRAFWDGWSDAYQRKNAPSLGIDEPTWGVWAQPERELRILGDVAGKDVLELGCGGAQWSVGLALRGARATGVDLSPAQLAHARRLVEERGVAVTLVEASAEAVPIADASFDVVFADHGAFTWCDPFRVVPEAARLLRPGGLLAFNMTTPIAELCWVAAADALAPALQRDYFDLHAIADATSVTFQLPYGEWIRLFRRVGLAVEDLVELRPPEGAVSTFGWDPAWARRWPAEHIWKLRRER